MKKKKKKRPLLAVLLPALLIAAALVAAYALILKRDIRVHHQRPVTTDTRIHNGEAAHKDRVAANKPMQQAGNGVSRAARRAKVAIIIDDLGYHRDIDRQLIRLDLPLSFAILPFAPFTEIAAREAAQRGREVMLHQPMEPKDYPCVDPGPGALLLAMDEAGISEIIKKNLKQVPGARGVNNHMGSSFTENREKMAILLRELKRRGLFYVDSRTTNGTVGLDEARKVGVPAAERTIFLDNNPDPEAICTQIGHLVRLAKGSGYAIGIGHAYPQTIEILKKYQHSLKNEVSVVLVSDLVR